MFLPAASLEQLHQGVFPAVLEEALVVGWVADLGVLQEGLLGVLHIQVVHHHLLGVHLLWAVLQVLAGHHLVVQGNCLGMLVVPLPYRADHCLLAGAFLLIAVGVSIWRPTIYTCYLCIGWLWSGWRSIALS